MLIRCAGHGNGDGDGMYSQIPDFNLFIHNSYLLHSFGEGSGGCYFLSLQ